MNIITEHPWTLILYLLAVLLQLAVTFFPRLKCIGWISALYHGGAVVLMGLAGGTLEYVLLFLLFSLTVGLVLALLVPDKRKAKDDKKEENA